MAIAGEYFRIFRHPGWEEDITWVIDENHQFILTYQELVAHGFWDLAYEQYEDLLKFQYLLGYNTEQQWKLLTNILFCICKAPEGANFLCKKNNAEVNQFLWNEGYSWLFAQNKNWLYLAQKEAYDDINWEDFVTSSDNKLLVYKSAYKAGEADFLLFHRQYKYYFRLKWKQLWKKKKNCE